MGPAIRKSISESFKELLQSLNKTLENSFSFESLGWRLESMRTGIPFAKIVVLKSLVYRIEQVFLIHRETGNLLQHIASEDVEVKDEDMVSGMFIAISDFAKDSFRVGNESTIDSFEIDDLTVFAVAGPKAIIACVIRGEAPRSIKTGLNKTLEEIHYSFIENFENYDGDNDLFSSSKSYLEDCLKVEYVKKEKKSVFSFKVILALLLFLTLFLWFAITQYKKYSELNNFTEKLKQSPGIIITNTKKESGKIVFEGFRDPLSLSPSRLYSGTYYNYSKDFKFNLASYHALDSGFVLKRCEKILQKPKTVSFEIKDGALILNGVSSLKWLESARKSWRFIPGIEKFDDQNMTSFEKNELVSLSQKILEHKILYMVGTSIKLLDKKSLDLIFADILKFFKLAKLLSIEAKISIMGHADDSGSLKRNIYLSKKRSISFYKDLLNRGILKKQIEAKSTGINSPQGKDPLGNDRNINRSVTFLLNF